MRVTRPRGQVGCPSYGGKHAADGVLGADAHPLRRGVRRLVARDQVIGRLGNRTVHEALAAGESAKDVWRAVCEHFEIPVKDRH